MVFVVIKIITQELEIESNLKQRLEFICEFYHIKHTIINGSIRKIDKTNLSYIEPHKIIVKDTIFLAFNYSTDIYVGSLNKKIQLVELKDYWNFSKFYILIIYLAIKLLNQFRMTIFGIKKMIKIKTKEKMITKLVCNHLFIIIFFLKYMVFPLFQ